jgi:HlyD family secretion protein
VDDQAELEPSTVQTARAAALLPHGKRRRAWAVAAATAVVVAGVGVWWWRISATPPVTYTTTPVSRGSVTQTATATGTVNPILTIIVGSYVSGVIESLSCDYNTVVTAGQVCAKVDPRPFQATLDQYAGQLLRDQAILAKDRANLVRYQNLVAQNSIARQQAEDQAFTVRQDEGTVKLDQALVDGAQLNLEYTNITSPVNGTVVSRNVTQGQTVAASFQTPTLFLIATDLKQMQVDTNISESDVGGIVQGDKATFTVDAYPGRVFKGTVNQVRLSPQTVQNVVTYDVVVGVDNSDLALMPGMTAATQIVANQRDNVLRVPDPALRYVPGGLAGARAAPNGPSRVWVLRNGAPVAVAVATGLDDGTYTEITKGNLDVGDPVITAELHPQSGSTVPVPRF